MKNLIIKTNKYYDSLPEMKRLLFFLIVIGGSQLMALFFMYVYDFIFAFLIWAGMVFLWRGSYIFLTKK